MSNYIDLVLCESAHGTSRLYQAPKFSHLDKGTLVIAESGDGEETLNVVSSISIATDSEEFAFIMELFKVDELERIKSKVRIVALDYKED